MNIALEETLRCKLRPLQIATLLLLTAYRNLPTPYPTVPSPTLYDVPFSHNTKRYRQTDDRQTDRTSYHKRDRTTQYGRLKIYPTHVLYCSLNVRKRLSCRLLI